MAAPTLYEKYGGFSRISKIVISFYDILLENDEVGPFFDNVDMSRMVDHQTKFIASLLGGPASYTDDQLRRMHSHLDITHAHFDELEAVLQGALEKHNVAAEDIDAVVTEFGKRRPLIVR
ncbi:hemoglobin [Ruegeria halocynthiae]|uniref:Hemoglobin n=1 Tax=Ruegeria halocynthiae TaxID=985054 RepID=A0A1H3EWA5_9RHOB|nr:group 1 truncated hemoglobin [Ruegeria halocynthiae]SDX82204.1 hemoglobin [Ruegeria halocynthiae]